MSFLLPLIVEVDHRSLRQVLFLPMPVEATIRSSASIVIALICGSLLLGACASERSPATPTAARYKIEVLEHGIDSQIIPDRFPADFDEDGQVDHLTVTDTSLHVLLSGGGEFRYRVGEPPDDSATLLVDVVLFSFNRDRRYPSIFLATERKTPERWVEPIRQQVVYNDSRRLILKTLSDYPLVGQSLDCAWLDFNDLPVCFYASYAGYEGMGMSRVLEIDPRGFWRKAMNSEYWAFRRSVSHYDSPATKERVSRPNRPSASRVVADWGNVELRVADSLLADGWAQAAETHMDSVRTLATGLFDRDRLYCADLAREYRLPWPVEISDAYDQQRRPEGRFMDGFMMLSARFTDFNGDGLLDLVAVGQHSGVFSAVAHKDGYFVAARYHGLPDEYVRVSAPPVPEDVPHPVPPCVYYGMERGQATKPDYVECYDRAEEQWYQLPLPEGSYWMVLEPVVFWDMNDDGMIDLAAKKEDGSWTAFTFVEESR
jgi:hypothetical protein